MSVLNIVFCVFLLSYKNILTLCSSESDTEIGNMVSTNTDRLDGQYLLNLGKQSKMPLLRLLGLTFMDYDCRYHHCTEWSTWSTCSAKYHKKFGVETRSRKCPLPSAQCDANVHKTETSDQRLCEGMCQMDYNITKHGFCIKYFGAQKLSNDDAKAACNASQGQLINVDTPDKATDYHEVLTQNGAIGLHTWIDGRRKDVNSPFVYSYGSELESIVWYPSHPSSGASFLCLGEVKHSNVQKRFSNPCSSLFNFACESGINM